MSPLSLVKAVFPLAFIVSGLLHPVFAAPVRAVGVMQTSPSAWGKGAGYLGSSLEQWAESVYNQTNINFDMRLIADEDKIQVNLARNLPILAFSEASVFFRFSQTAMGRKLKFQPIGAFFVQNNFVSQTCFNENSSNPNIKGIAHLRNTKLAISSEENYLLLKLYFEKYLKGQSPLQFFSEVIVIEDKVSGLLAVKKNFVKAYLTRESAKVAVEGLGSPILRKPPGFKPNCIGLWPNSIYYTNSLFKAPEKVKIQTLLTQPNNPAMKFLQDFFNTIRSRVVKISSPQLAPYQKLYNYGFSKGWLAEYKKIRLGRN